MKAGKITTLGHALLGLIHNEPRTGYALRKVFQTTPMGHYSSSPGAIYPALRRLEEQGLIVGRVHDGRTLRPKRVYEISASGVEALRAWVSEPVTRDEVVWRADELMLRFGFMGGLAPAPLTQRFLEDLVAALDSRIDELRTYRASMPETWAPHGRLAVEAGIEHLQGWARWATRAATHFVSRPSGKSS